MANEFEPGEPGAQDSGGIEVPTPSGAPVSSAGRRLAKAATLVMVATALSRVLGYAREVVQAALFGAGMQVDAYRVAVQLPNLFRIMLADAAISAAFIPVLSSFLARNEEDEAWRFISTVANLMALVFLGVVVFALFFASPLVNILAPGFAANPAKHELSVYLARIMFPALLFMAGSGIVQGILNSYDRFFVGAISPVLWNIVIIASMVVFGQRYGIVSLAAGLTMATVAQFLFQVPFIGKPLRKYRPVIDLHHPGVREFLGLLIPIVLSAATTDINTVVDSRFASFLGEGSVASLGYAIRVFMVPTGIFGVAIATVLYPTLSRQATRKEYSELLKNLSAGIRTIIALITPVTVFFVAFALPIVRFLFERGKFTASASLMTASPVLYYCLGLVAMSVATLLNRAFYAMKDSRTPLYVAVASIVVNYVGDWVLMRALPFAYRTLGLPASLAWLGYGHGGIALSTSIVVLFQALTLAYLFRRKFGPIEGRSMLAVSVRTLAASLVALIPAYFVYTELSRVVAGTLGLLAGIVASLTVFCGLYLALAILFKVREVSTGLSLVLSRIRGARKD
jgi:putative peptidoglycan lipid II flippase